MEKHVKNISWKDKVTNEEVLRRVNETGKYTTLFGEGMQVLQVNQQ